jgi:hypothetical protein
MVEKTYRLVVQGFLWPKLDAKTVIVYAIVPWRVILICWAYVRAKCVSVIQKESLLMKQGNVKHVNR